MDEERQRGGTLLAHIKGHENEDESQVCCTSPLGRQKRELRRNITQRVSRGLGNRVPSLLFDIEMEGSDSATLGEQEPVLPAKTVETLYACLEASTDEEVKLRENVEQAAQQCTFTDVPNRSSLEDNQQLALQLQQHWGYTGVRVRTALGGGDGHSCLRNLRHMFLTTQLAGRTYIIDLAFKEQFIIAKPTDKYAVLLDCLPAVHVAEEGMVRHLVTFLCNEMAESFQQQASVLPPWRQVDSMLSKWLPRRSLDKPADSMELLPLQTHPSADPSSSELNNNYAGDTMTNDDPSGPHLCEAAAATTLATTHTIALLSSHCHAPSVALPHTHMAPHENGALHPPQAHTAQHQFSSSNSAADIGGTQLQQCVQQQLIGATARHVTASATAGATPAGSSQFTASLQEAQERDARTAAHCVFPVGMLEQVHTGLPSRMVLEMHDRARAPQAAALTGGFGHQVRLQQGVEQRPMQASQRPLEGTEQQRQHHKPTGQQQQHQHQHVKQQGSSTHPISFEPHVVKVGGDFTSI